MFRLSHRSSEQLDRKTKENPEEKGGGDVGHIEHYECLKESVLLTAEGIYS